MWKSALVGVYQLLNWKMHGETLKYQNIYKWLCQRYQRVSVSDPANNGGRNENETSPLRTT